MVRYGVCVGLVCLFLIFQAVTSALAEEDLGLTCLYKCGPYSEPAWNHCMSNCMSGDFSQNNPNARSTYSACDNCKYRAIEKMHDCINRYEEGTSAYNSCVKDANTMWYTCMEQYNCF